MALRLDWDRSAYGVSETRVGDVVSTVHEDKTITPPFVWQATGCADTRYKAIDAAERAVLASLATSRSAPEWVAALMQMALSGEAYLMIKGVRDTHTLPTVCRMALDGASGPQIVVMDEKRDQTRKRKR